jgi:hypothetical protein
MTQIAENPGLLSFYRGYLSKSFSKDHPYSEVYTTYMLLGKPQADDSGTLLLTEA